MLRSSGNSNKHERHRLRGVHSAYRGCMLLFAHREGYMGGSRDRVCVFRGGAIVPLSTDDDGTAEGDR